MAPEPTIRQEMVKLYINPEDFDVLYSLLKETQQLPPGDVIPWEQYVRGVGYLRTKGVLGDDNKIQPENFKLFDGKRTLEEEIEAAFAKVELRPRMNSGGIAPCREYDAGSGGIAPCRDYNIDFDYGLRFESELAPKVGDPEEIYHSEGGLDPDEGDDDTYHGEAGFDPEER